jgi:hypothetical protein
MLDHFIPQALTLAQVQLCMLGRTTVITKKKNCSSNIKISYLV